ncbi:MAG: prepilin-type N-terminal cleavage/methylation domain-containing protein [Chloroflexi bacterium]|nr:prepilin-type N-terminal cleavage/methylation domain-containing protein [Chloroflexota bacterium]
MFRDSDKGFTLIELLIVIAVVGVLAGVAVPSVSGFLTAGKVQAANVEAAAVETASGYYLARNASYPADSSPFFADDLVTVPLRAKYYFHQDTGKIGNAAGKYVSRIDGADNDWVEDGLVFDTATRKWVKGAVTGTEGDTGDATR